MNCYSVRLAAHRKSAGLSQPSLDPECAQLSSQIGRVAFAVPGDLATPTGGYRYDRHIIQELRRLGWQVDVLDLGAGFPFPSVVQRAAALAILSAVQDGCPIVLDGLAFGALAEAGALRFRTPLIALVHQPLALDSGLEAAQANAIIFNSNGMQVAVVIDGKAEIRKVGVKRDMGTQVEVDSGVKAGDQAILNPPVNLADGSKVQVRTEVAAASGR
jgi:hypothetical protein